MSLTRYRQKRDFEKTREPRGAPGRKAKKNGHSFVVQKHAARALHYDFRLELDGVLLSWAIPKGPSLDPSVKRLAVQTEDHPIEYGGFEGTIPKGEYGGGSVVVWDRGEWKPEGDAREMYEKGRLNFELVGEKLRGSFHLVKTRGRGQTRSGKTADRQWLLIKSDDAEAERGSDGKLVEEKPDSVLTGRSVEDVAKDPDRVWGKSGAKKAATRQTAEKRTARAKGPKTSLPPFVEPELATLVDRAPEGDDYLHELKLDGYRILARKDGGKVRLLSRRGNDWTSRMPTVAAAVAALPIESGLLDGEVVVLGKNGVSSFQLLQNSLEAGKDGASLYFVFDALFLDGQDLRKQPLVERKRALAEALSGAGKKSAVRLSEHVVGGGKAFFEHAAKLGLEGIVSKRVNAPYVSGRTRSWLKVKSKHRQEFVIGGFTEPANSREHFGALLLGVREGSDLVYAGKVGTGFTAQSLKEIKARLARLEQKSPAFSNPPRGAQAKGVHWLAPKMVAEVEFAERTNDGHVRHGSFLGLREDKAPEDVVLEKPEKPEKPEKAKKAAPAPTIDVSRLRLTHPDRVLYPEQGITKGDLALYYAEVARWMLPHVTQRPLMIVRCPEGTGKACFHQKHPSRGMPEGVGQVDVGEERSARRAKKPSEPHLKIDDALGLVGLVQMGALEIHTWGCKEGDIERPDQLVLDIDPDEALPWARVAEAARTLKAALAKAGLTGFLKTTGGKGLHVVVPLVPSATWEEAKDFCKALVLARASAEPTKYLAVMTKEKRKGKIFLDYLRNGRGATSVCVFSTRARAGAPVSTPLAWSELDDDERPAFDIANVPERLASSRKNPWQGFDDARAKLPRVTRA